MLLYASLEKVRRTVGGDGVVGRYIWRVIRAVRVLVRSTRFDKGS